MAHEGITYTADTQLKGLLANRLQENMAAIERLRALTPYTPEEYANAARGISDRLAAISELERVWEALYGEVPSVLEVGQAANAVR